MEDILKKLSLKDLLNYMRKDDQYLSLFKLYNNIYYKNINKLNELDKIEKLNVQKIFLTSIIINSLVCYQLSGKGEDYWAEFSLFMEYNYKKIISNIDINNKSTNNIYNNIINYIKLFIIGSKNNKRLLDIKIKRIDKINIGILSPLINNLLQNDYNFKSILEEIAKIMNQKITDKTIVFSLKMLYYGVDIIVNNNNNTNNNNNKNNNNQTKRKNSYVKNTSKDETLLTIKLLPNINIPLDSRIRKIFLNEYGTSKDADVYTKMNQLQKHLKYSLLYYDAFLWNNRDKA